MSYKIQRVGKKVEAYIIIRLRAEIKKIAELHVLNNCATNIITLMIIEKSLFLMKVLKNHYLYHDDNFMRFFYIKGNSACNSCS